MGCLLEEEEWGKITGYGLKLILIATVTKVLTALNSIDQRQNQASILHYSVNVRNSIWLLMVSKQQVKIEGLGKGSKIMHKTEYSKKRAVCLWVLCRVDDNAHSIIDSLKALN